MSEDGSMHTIMKNNTKSIFVIKLDISSNVTKKHFDIGGGTVKFNINIEQTLEVFKELKQLKRRLEGKKYNVDCRSLTDEAISKHIYILISNNNETYIRDKSIDDFNILNDRFGRLSDKIDVKLDNGVIEISDQDLVTPLNTIAIKMKIKEFGVDIDNYTITQHKIPDVVCKYILTPKSQ